MCSSDLWLTAGSIPLWLLVKDPRIEQKKYDQWRVRPLDIQKMLELKVKVTGFTGELSFTIDDPMIPTKDRKSVV